MDSLFWKDGLILSEIEVSCGTRFDMVYCCVNVYFAVYLYKEL